MMIQFGPWTPDQPAFNNTCITATNVLAVQNGFAPFMGPRAVSDALVEAPVGAVSFRRVDGTRETFAGTESGLYRLNGTVWTDVTPAGGVSASEFWRFTVFGTRLIATNGIDNPQKFVLASDSVFSDLTNAPIAKNFIVVRNIVIAVDVQDGSGYQVKFSAVDDSQTWTIPEGGGNQEFTSGGPVVGGTGGEYGVILQENAVTRMDFVGGDLRFTFDEIEGAIGCIDSASIIEHKGNTYYLSEEGFQIFNGAESVNIAEERVSNTFFAGFDKTRSTSGGDTRVTGLGETRVVSFGDVVQAALSPRDSVVCWSYPVGGVNKLIVYNYKIDQWTESDASITSFHTASLKNGQALAGFNSDNKLVLFDGPQQSAVLSTGDMQAGQGRAQTVSGRGIVDSAHDITVSKKTALSDTATTVTGSSNSEGKVSIRANARYMRFQLNPTADFTEISGIDVELREAGGGR